MKLNDTEKAMLDGVEGSIFQFRCEPEAGVNCQLLPFGLIGLKVEV